MKYKFLLVFSLLFLLVSCSKPIDELHKSYVGEWQGKQMWLLIEQSGNVSYKRKISNVTTSVNAPLQEFTNEGFVVGVWSFTTVFTVSEPPKKVEGKWQMVVDGVRLTKLNN